MALPLLTLDLYLYLLCHLLVYPTARQPMTRSHLEDGETLLAGEFGLWYFVTRHITYLLETMDKMGLLLSMFFQGFYAFVLFARAG